MNHTYRARNDFVLFQLVDRGEVAGILMPERSAQGKERVVLTVGPDVVDLEVGDKVLVIGEMGVDVIILPTEQNVFMTKQANVALVVEEPDE